MNKNVADDALRGLMGRRMPAWARYALVLAATAVFAVFAYHARYAKIDEFTGFRMEEMTRLIAGVLADLKELMELPGKPAFATVLRPASGIPQMEAGYSGLLDWRQALSAAHPSLHLCGFGWKGIGINDMIKEARQMAEALCTRQQIDQRPEVKGVYF